MFTATQTLNQSIVYLECLLEEYLGQALREIYNEIKRYRKLCLAILDFHKNPLWARLKIHYPTIYVDNEYIYLEEGKTKMLLSGVLMTLSIEESIYFLTHLLDCIDGCVNPIRLQMSQMLALETRWTLQNILDFFKEIVNLEPNAMFMTGYDFEVVEDNLIYYDDSEGVYKSLTMSNIGCWAEHDLEFLTYLLEHLL
jgi:hypothetical protein